jgi:thioredoxin reductase (NADPH)
MMADMENQAKRFGTDIRNGWVTKVDFSGSKHFIEIDNFTLVYAFQQKQQ